jgi:hypothetical protein
MPEMYARPNFADPVVGVQITTGVIKTFFHYHINTNSEAQYPLPPKKQWCFHKINTIRA